MHQYFGGQAHFSTGRDDGGAGTPMRRRRGRDTLLVRPRHAVKSLRRTRQRQLTRRGVRRRPPAPSDYKKTCCTYVPTVRYAFL